MYRIKIKQEITDLFREEQKPQYLKQRRNGVYFADDWNGNSPFYKKIFSIDDFSKIKGIYGRDVELEPVSGLIKESFLNEMQLDKRDVIFRPAIPNGMVATVGEFEDYLIIHSESVVDSVLSLYEGKLNTFSSPALSAVLGVSEETADKLRLLQNDIFVDLIERIMPIREFVRLTVRFEGATELLSPAQGESVELRDGFSAYKL